MIRLLISKITLCNIMKMFRNNYNKCLYGRLRVEGRGILKIMILNLKKTKLMKFKDLFKLRKKESIVF